MLWPREYLFVFGHMRCYSSVLTHILGSHPEIAGYTESHLKYRHRADLALLRWKICAGAETWPRGRYLLDKLLHDTMCIPRRLHNSRRLRSLILIRRPEPTLRSILKMGRFTERMEQLDPEKAAGYYCRRLATLSALAMQLGDRALAFPAEAITQNTEPLLARVTDHLDLQSPLQSSYKVRKLSHSGGYSHYSESILQGQIVADNSGPPAPSCREELAVQQAASATTIAPSKEIAPSTGEPIPEELLAVCERAHERTVHVLENWCPSFAFAHSAAQPERANRLMQRILRDF